MAYVSNAKHTAILHSTSWENPSPRTASCTHAYPRLAAQTSVRFLQSVQRSPFRYLLGAAANGRARHFGGQQPAVILLDVDEDELPALRVAVCPLDASDEAMARLTEERMAAILEVAQASGDAEVIIAETDPACIALLVWALPGLPPPTTPMQENDPAAAGHLPAGPHLHNRDAVINLEPDERLEFTLTPERARRTTPGDEAPSTSATTVPMASHPTPVDTASVTAQAPVVGGRPLFGFRRRGGRLVADPEEAPIVATILAGNDADLTLDRILIRLMEEHGAWVREHWAPKERGRLVVRILDREDAYRRDLLPALAILDGRADGDAANDFDGAAA